MNDNSIPSDLEAQANWKVPLDGVISGLLELVKPPPQRPATLQAGTIEDYCVGGPWNQQAVFMGTGVPVITAAAQAAEQDIAR